MPFSFMWRTEMNNEQQEKQIRELMKELINSPEMSDIKLERLEFLIGVLIMERSGGPEAIFGKPLC